MDISSQIGIQSPHVKIVSRHPIVSEVRCRTWSVFRPHSPQNLCL